MKNDVFCEICEVLQNIILTKDSWATASDFQQDFGHITCSFSNKSTQSQLTVCLGPPQRAVRASNSQFLSQKYLKQPSSKETNKKGYLTEAVTQRCFTK